MSSDVAAAREPLWLAMERKIAELSSSGLSSDTSEGAVRKLAKELDGAGYNVSRHAANMLDLRAAVDARIKVGRPLIQDLTAATEALTIEDVVDTLRATVKLAGEVGEEWPRVQEAARRPDILAIVNKAKLDLLVETAKGMDGDKGSRFLIGEGVSDAKIIDELGITEAQLGEVHAAIAAERAAIERLEQLLEEVADASDVDKVRHLITNDVEEALIVDHAGFGQEVIDSAKHAMEAEIAEKRRLAEEEAARKAAEAAGPSLDEIPADELEEYIEEIREILEFSDQEDEIRKMCETSNIPKALVEIAVSDPDKLDELEG